MAVMIRLQRQGAKKNPSYLIVAVDSDKKRDGEYLAKIGQYFPKVKNPKEKVIFNPEMLAKWKARGAQPTQTVGQLLKTASK